jgi:hypothetical protein
MSNSRILNTTLEKWSRGKRRKLGPGWGDEDLSWNANNIVNQFIRYAGFMYSSTSDFEDWLDTFFDSQITKTMKDAGKPISVWSG